MARYFRINPRFWLAALERGWDEPTRLLALYVLTCNHRTADGFYRLPKEYICADLAWTAKHLEKPLQALQDSRFLLYDEQTQAVFCRALKVAEPSSEAASTATERGGGRWQWHGSKSIKASRRTEKLLN